MEQQHEKEFNILIVDDDQDVRDTLYWTLKRNKLFKCSVLTASDPDEAFPLIEKQDFDAIISDYRMPKMDGIEFFKIVREESPITKRILITGYSDLHLARDAINKAKVDYYIEKPWNKDTLREVMYDILSEKAKEDKETIARSPAQRAGLTSADDALKLVYEIQKRALKSEFQIDKEDIVVLEFSSTVEFNRFSFEAKKIKNTYIKDVQIAGGKYFVTVAIFPPSYERIK